MRRRGVRGPSPRQVSRDPSFRRHHWQRFRRPETTHTRRDPLKVPHHATGGGPPCSDTMTRPKKIGAARRPLGARFQTPIDTLARREEEEDPSSLRRPLLRDSAGRPPGRGRKKKKKIISAPTPAAKHAARRPRRGRRRSTPLLGVSRDARRPPAPGTTRPVEARNSPLPDDPWHRLPPPRRSAGDPILVCAPHPKFRSLSLPAPRTCERTPTEPSRLPSIATRRTNAPASPGRTGREKEILLGSAATFVATRPAGLHEAIASLGVC